MVNRGQLLLVPGAFLALLAAAAAIRWIDERSATLAAATNLPALGALLVLGLACLARARSPAEAKTGPRVVRGFALVLLGAVAATGVLAAVAAAPERGQVMASERGPGRALEVGAEADIRPSPASGVGVLDSVSVLVRDSRRHLGATSLRAAPFNLTLEAFQTVRRLLRPGGTFVLEIQSDRPRLPARVYLALQEAFHEHPPLYVDPSNGRFVFVAGYRPGPPRSGLRALQIPYLPVMPLVTDDAPEEIEDFSAPGAHAAALGAIALVAALAALLAGPWAERRSRFHWLLQGALSWLLLALSQVALVPLAGTSPRATALEAGAVIMMMLLAAGLVAVGRAPGQRAGAWLLAVALVACFQVPAGALAASFFAGVVLARALEQEARLAAPLGLWLLGGALGGVLEHAHFVVGVRALAGIAFVVAAAALAARRVTR